MKHMEFHTEDPIRLARELTGLEDNVERAIREVVSATAPRPIVDSFMPLGTVTIAPLLPDHQLSIDTTQANALAVLPAVTPANFGRCFVLIKRFTANQIAVSCADPTATHNAGAFPIIGVGTAGVRVFYCDARGYYS